MTAQNIRGTQNPGLPVFAVSEDGTFYNTTGDKDITAGAEHEMIRIVAITDDCYFARGNLVFPGAPASDGLDFDWEIILAGTIREFMVVNGGAYTLRVETGQAYVYLY